MMTTPEIGQVLGHYRIAELIGSGGMGVVFRAHDEQLRRDVAVKILPQLSQLSEAARRQFRREALSVARITDANVAMAFDFGRDHGFDYLVTEYVPGITLNAKLAGRPLLEGEVLHLGRQLASGLENAHRQGVIHRDLKPGNLRVTPEGRLKILDFGLAFLLHTDTEAQSKSETTVTASLTDSFEDAGTLPYMSPEQVKGNKPDARADVWSAGAVLYEMSTGRAPFGDLTGGRLMAAILEQAPPLPRTLNPKISVGLERVMLRALEKDPGERYQSAGDLRIDLNSLATGTLPIYARPASRRWVWWLAAAVAVVLAVGGIWWKHRATRSVFTEDQILAVLPFEAVANDGPTNALGAGLSETLTAKLVQGSDEGHLQLVSTRDLVAHGIKTADQARQEFGTDLVLEGSLQQFGDQIRITCNLVDSHTHLQRAARTVTGSASDPFKLEDALVEEVVAMLPGAMGGQDRASRESRPDTKPAAYEFYLRGRGYLEDYKTPNSLGHAIEEFGHAVEVDANYAPAHAAMGIAYATGFKWENRGKDWLDNAQRECERSLEIMPQLAEGHTCLGNVYSSRGRYADAVQQFQRSLDLNHDSDETLRLLAAAYQSKGDVAAAEQAFRGAVALRPNYYGVYGALGTFYYNQGRYVDAAAIFRKEIQLAPSYYRAYSNLAGCLIVLGQYGEAVDALKKSVELRPSFDDYGNLGTAYFYLKRYEDSAQAFQRALQINDRDWQNWGSLGDALYQIPSRKQESLSAYLKAVELASARLEVNPQDAVTLALTADFYAMLDEEKEARQHLLRALAIAPKNPDVLFRAAIVSNHFANTEETLKFLKRAIEAGLPPAQIRDTPDFDGLRNDARLRALLSPN
jgi:eukaryotic-like serine/threonine-protein kinase